MRHFLQSPKKTVYCEGHNASPAVRGQGLPNTRFRRCVGHLIQSVDRICQEPEGCVYTVSCIPVCALGSFSTILRRLYGYRLKFEARLPISPFLFFAKHSDLDLYPRAFTMGLQDNHDRFNSLPGLLRVFLPGALDFELNCREGSNER